MKKLENKVAIVTGASSGMGRAVAVHFAREGAAVVVGGRDPERTDETVSMIRKTAGKAVAVLGDVQDPATHDEMVKTALHEYGAVDIAVSCAGMLGLGAITELSLDTWRATMATNLDAVFFLARRSLPEMLKRDKGVFLVIGSIAAWKVFPGHPAYCASKGALLPLVKQIALDYGPQIRANMICPGPVDTPLIWDSAAAFPNPEQAVSDAAEATALKRLGTPEDIARAALFLCADDAAWITGTALTVDGGRMLL